MPDHVPDRSSDVPAPPSAPRSPGRTRVRVLRTITLVACAIAALLALALAADAADPSDSFAQLLLAGFLFGPIAIAFFVGWVGAPLARADTRGGLIGGVATTGFTLGLVGPIALFHLAWLGDWGGTATGSSTSAIGLVIVPIYAVVTGVLGAAVGAIAGACIAFDR